MPSPKKVFTMSYIQFLANATQQLYDGTPWLEVTFAEHMRRTDAAQAVQRVNGSHCIWELVNHVVFWHQHVLRCMNNEQPEQDGDLPDFYLPENHGTENWEAAKRRLQHSFEQMVAAIAAFPEEKLFIPFPGTDQLSIYYLHGVTEHDAYHLGQIVLLRKYSVPGG